MAKALGNLKRVEVRSMWANEARNFTPWLAENLSLLGAEIGIGLELKTTEANAGLYSADILAKDTVTDRFVVIENQLGKTDHSHLGQSITYASVLDASTVIWIANTFTDEHRKAIDWLNEHFTDDIVFYAVQVELWQIDDSSPAVKFNIVSRPPDIDRIDVVSGDESKLNKTEKTRLDFWRQFKEALLAAGIKTNRKPKPYYHFDLPVGRGGFWLACLAMSDKGMIGIRLFIDRKFAGTAFPLLYDQRDAIEQELGESLEWNPDQSTLDRYVGLYRKADFQHKAKWKEYINWLISNAKAFQAVFQSRLTDLELVTESGSEEDES